MVSEPVASLVDPHMKGAVIFSGPEGLFFQLWHQAENFYNLQPYILWPSEPWKNKTKKNTDGKREKQP